MKVFLVSTNDEAWLLSAGNSATAVFRVTDHGLLDCDGPIQVTAREYTESAWMALVSSAVAERLRGRVNLSVCGHEALLDTLKWMEIAGGDARRELAAATAAYDRASAAEIVDVRKILEDE